MILQYIVLLREVSLFIKCHGRTDVFYCVLLSSAGITLPSWVLPVSWTGTLGHRAGFGVSCTLPPWHPGNFLHYKWLCPHGCISLYKKGFTYCFGNKTIKFTNRFWNSIFSWKFSFSVSLNMWNKMQREIKT